MNAWLVREHNPNPDTRLPSEPRTASYGVFLQEEPPRKLRLPGITWGVAMLADLVLSPKALAELTVIRLQPGEGPGGGMMKTPSAQVPTAWLTYVLVESVADCVAKAKALGGWT